MTGGNNSHLKVKNSYVTDVITEKKKSKKFKRIAKGRENFTTGFDQQFNTAQPIEVTDHMEMLRTS